MNTVLQKQLQSSDPENMLTTPENGSHSHFLPCFFFSDEQGYVVCTVCVFLLATNGLLKYTRCLSNLLTEKTRYYFYSFKCQ